MGADTVSLDPKYEETSWEHERLFQKYSLDNRIYPVPIDEASAGSSCRATGNANRSYSNRTRKNASMSKTMC